ncbi:MULTISPECIES: hypothetical protein [Kitasatospora]|uniref:Uncharacterized protein n=1 Tax=Kitasatospora setae (strain ATCC 33774 / DSM 43861 / JCM 3304 / KCC A-0304 / NBRC 14216 / KM-6054) TaxID=452652 RepID=E4N7F7_KITSK|nr:MULTISPECIES: hypothetical protein [Kitasatospora]BAJ27138.1 hypothetical protein KSE_13080 [Kitasatospora setae KM-6054]
MLIAPAAQAADSTAPVPLRTDLPVQGTPPALSTEAQAIVDARAKAKSTNQPVVVEAMTTETSRTLANPDGTLSTTDNALPTRLKQGSGWADLDPTLHVNADGSLSPAVSRLGLKLSGGGSGAMAVLTTDDSKHLSVGAPFALPKPTVSGATATYANVLADVDLQVTALPQGGWRDVIIVKTAAAAADPALRTLHFPLSGNGLTASTDAAGNLSFKDSAGKVRLHGPTPFQWDSSLPASPTRGGTAVNTRSMLAAPQDSGTPAGGSTPIAPGEGPRSLRSPPNSPPPHST